MFDSPQILPNHMCAWGREEGFRDRGHHEGSVVPITTMPFCFLQNLWIRMLHCCYLKARSAT